MKQTDGNSNDHFNVPEGTCDVFEQIFQDCTEKEHLRAELEKYTSLLNATGRMAKVGGWEVIVATKEVRWTQETYRIHELPLDTDFQLNDALDFYHPEDQPMLLRALEEAMQQGKPYDLELRITTAKGNKRHTRTICTPILKKGQVVRLRGTFQDITEQKRAEQALVESEKRYRQVAQNSPAVVAQHRMDAQGNVSFLFITDTVQDLLGVPAETVMRDASTLMRLIHPDDLEGYQRASLDSFRNLTDFHHELRLIKPDGHEMWVEIHSVPEPQPDDSVVWDGFFLEITKRKQAEKQLILQHDLLKIAGKTSRFGGWSVDLVNDTHFWSDTVRQIHEVPEDYQPSLEEGIHFYAPESREIITRVFTDCAENGTPYDEELQLITAKGNRLWVRTCGRAELDDSGNVIGVHGSFQDITEERKMQERLRHSEKMEAVGRLAGGIAHDFNNQLAAIMGFAELLQYQIKDPVHQHYVKNIISAAKRSADLTKKLLAFARRDTLRNIPFDPHQLIDETLSVLERSIDKRIQIQKELTAQPSLINGDPSSVENGLLHVCFNASEAMPDGEVLRLKTEVVDVDEAFAESRQVQLKSGPYFVISVTDTGCGISESILPHVFEPFFTTKPFVEGAGMGLSAVQGTMKAHGGDVAIESEEGRGTSVSLYFPLSSKKAEASTGSTTSTRPQDQTGLSFLVVDDEPLIRNLLGQFLELSGHTALKASAGKDAVDCFRREWRHIDLVLLDLMMPDMDGAEVFRQFKEIDPHVNVILVSGYHLDMGTQQLLDAGAKGFLHKPFTQAALMQEVKRVLEEVESLRKVSGTP